MKKIEPCLWFNGQAEAAAKFYSTVFENSRMGQVVRYNEAAAHVSGQPAGSVMTVEFELEGLTFMGLNGGPHFKFTPAISFFVGCNSAEEIQTKWRRLAEGGEVRMELDKYPWAEKYGWVADQFGVDWQLMLAPRAEKIVPAFLFANRLFGKGEEAINFYLSLFKTAKINELARDEKTNTVLFADFTLANQGFVLMEGAGTHNFTFTEATSLIMNCGSQEEVDRFWARLTEGGEESRCGWLKDKYGVSWQIFPVQVGEWLRDPAKASRVMTEILKMKKIDIATLERAANG